MLNFAVAGVVLIPVYIIYLLYQIFRRKRAVEDIFILIVLMIYSLGVINIVFFPIPFQKEYINTLNAIDANFRHNFIPLHTILTMAKEGTRQFLKQVLGNILLFVPLGFLVPLLIKQKVSILKTGIVTLITSVIIEFIQFILSQIIGFNYRSVDIDDIILNVLGGICGYLFFFVTFPILGRFISFQEAFQEGGSIDKREST